jgi:hypothetical protein
MANRSWGAPRLIGDTTLISSPVSPNLMMYSNGVINLTNWPTSTDYSYGGGITFTAAPSGTSGNMTTAWQGDNATHTLNLSNGQSFPAVFAFNSTLVTWSTTITGSPTTAASTIVDDYVDTITPQAGHTYSLFVPPNSGWQQATNWGVSPPNGLDISAYTKIKFDLNPPASFVCEILGHCTRSTGNDLNICAQVPDLTKVPGIGTIMPGQWNTGLTVPLSFLGMLSSANYYKIAMQNGGPPAGMRFDNVQFIPGNTYWIYNGDPAVAGLQSGWVDASSNATPNYTFVPDTINANFFACNNPTAASAFTGTLSGSTLTVSALTGTIYLGQQLVNFTGGAPTVWGTITGGSFPTYTITSPGGNFSGASCASSWLQQQLEIINLNVTATGGIWRANNASGLGLSPYTTLTFAALPTLTGNDYIVKAYNTSGVQIGNTITITAGSLTYTPYDGGLFSSVANPPFYTVYSIPLTALGISGATLGGVSIQDNSGNATNTIYLSAIGFYS